MKNIKKIFVLAIVLLLSNCGKGDDNESFSSNIEDEVTTNYSTENIDVNTSQIVKLTSSTVSLNEKYEGTFGGYDVELIKISDNDLIFVIPNLESGEHQLVSSLGTINFNVKETVIENSEEIISNVFTSFDNEVNLNESSDDIDNAKALKNEVVKLYESLTDEEKNEVALFYQANKTIFKEFKENLITANSKSTIVSSKIITQSNCPQTDFRSLYSCRADNLGASANVFLKSLKKLAEPIAYSAALGKIAASAWYLGPSVWGLTAVGASLSVGTAMYILITEVRPTWINFKSNLTSFMGANWILADSILDVVNEQYNNGEATEHNIEAELRAIKESDSDISPEVSFFTSSYNSLNSIWNDFSSLLGTIPSFGSSYEPISLTGDDIQVSNISNSNVVLEGINGDNLTFTSLSGEEEAFSFDLTVNKEGFSVTKTIIGQIGTAENNLKLQGTWKHVVFKVEDCDSDRIFTATQEVDFERIIDFGHYSETGEQSYYFKSDDYFCSGDLKSEGSEINYSSGSGNIWVQGFLDVYNSDDDIVFLRGNTSVHNYKFVYDNVSLTTLIGVIDEPFYSPLTKYTVVNPVVHMLIKL